MFINLFSNFIHRGTATTRWKFHGKMCRLVGASQTLDCIPARVAAFDICHSCIAKKSTL